MRWIIVIHENEKFNFTIKTTFNIITETFLRSRFHRKKSKMNLYFILLESKVFRCVFKSVKAYYSCFIVTRRNLGFGYFFVKHFLRFIDIWADRCRKKFPSCAWNACWACSLRLYTHFLKANKENVLLLIQIFV